MLAIVEDGALGAGQVIEQQLAANMNVDRVEVRACLRVEQAVDAALEGA